MDVWPEKSKPALWRFNGVFLELSQETTMIERQTYNLLEWVGDVGGLYDGLRLIFSSIIAPVAAFAMQSELLSLAFKQVDQTESTERKTKTNLDLSRSLSKIPR